MAQKTQQVTTTQTQQETTTTRSFTLPEDFWIHVALVALCLLVLFPIGYTLLTSLRPQGFGLSSNLIHEDGFFFGHYQRLLSTPRFARNILNSFINSFGGAFVTTAVCACAGYAFARLKFAGQRFLLIFILAMMMLPGITNLIPLFKIASDLGILDTYLVIILVYGSYGVPFGVWVMKGFYESIPRVLEEAAAVDGANPLQTLIHVIIPVSMPGLIAIFLVNFVYNWNDFLTALILLSSNSMKTATVGLFDFQSQLEGNNDELLAAAAIIIMIPGIMLFLLARKAFLKGMVEGAVKG